MPVTPYAEPKIQSNIATTWPQTVEERLAALTERIEQLSAVLGELSVLHGSFFEHSIEHEAIDNADD